MANPYQSPRSSLTRQPASSSKMLVKLPRRSLVLVFVLGSLLGSVVLSLVPLVIYHDIHLVWICITTFAFSLLFTFLYKQYFKTAYSIAFDKRLFYSIVKSAAVISMGLNFIFALLFTSDVVLLEKAILTASGMFAGAVVGGINYVLFWVLLRMECNKTAIRNPDRINIR